MQAGFCSSVPLKVSEHLFAPYSRLLFSCCLLKPHWLVPVTAPTVSFLPPANRNTWKEKNSLCVFERKGGGEKPMQLLAGSSLLLCGFNQLGAVPATGQVGLNQACDNGS